MILIFCKQPSSLQRDENCNLIQSTTENFILWASDGSKQRTCSVSTSQAWSHPETQLWDWSISSCLSSIEKNKHDDFCSYSSGYLASNVYEGGTIFGLASGIFQVHKYVSWHHILAPLLCQNPVHCFNCIVLPVLCISVFVKESSRLEFRAQISF